jgi:hypothetical protein
MQTKKMFRNNDYQPSLLFAYVRQAARQKDMGKNRGDSAPASRLRSSLLSLNAGEFSMMKLLTPATVFLAAADFSFQTSCRRL